jgi:maltooligosyltrehalose trehalohydrolase
LDTATIPATRLLAYTLTHDQVGNRAIGDRPSQNLDFGQLAVKAALVLGSPYTAMLFMGEEWGSSSPFLFFSSHPEPELARATAEGRKAEFAEHGWDADEVPDPQDPETFQRSKLDWAEVGGGAHIRLWNVYRDLIALRRREPDLADPWLDDLRIEYDEEQRWIVMHRGALAIAWARPPRPYRSQGRSCSRGTNRRSARRRYCRVIRSSCSAHADHQRCSSCPNHVRPLRICCASPSKDGLLQSG